MVQDPRPQAKIKASSNIAVRAALFSAVMAVAIFALKSIAYEVTGSTAVLSDALESIVNVFASAFTLFVMRQAVQPADEDHPYGHGKFESLASAFEGGLISFAALIIVGEAIRSFTNGRELQALDVGAAWAGAAAILNLIVGAILWTVARKQKSIALKASAVHLFSDVLTTLGSITALALVYWTGRVWIDPLIAWLFAVWLGVTGYRLVRQAGSVLIDEMDPEAVSDLARALQNEREVGIIDIHYLRMIRAGQFHHVDAHLVLPEYWDVKLAHSVALAFENRVVNAYNHEGEIAFHIDPCERKYCQICAVAECPVRRQPFVHQKDFSVLHVIRGPDTRIEGEN